jgi:methylthioribose-1-phosphate isomerase
VKNLVVSGAIALVVAASFSIFAEEAKENPEVDPKAKEIIERAVDYLAKTISC